LLGYAAIMGALLYLYSAPTLERNPWKNLDVRIYGALSGLNEPPELDRNLVLIDLPYQSENTDLTGFRANLGRLLSCLAEHRPRVVVLDIAIQNDPRGLKNVQSGLEALMDKNIKVYAAVDPRRENSDEPDPNYLERHDPKTYRELLEGFGHTVMMTYGPMLLYDRELEIASGQRLPALAVKITEDQPGHYKLREGPPIIVPLGKASAVDAHIWRAQFTDAGSLNFLPRRETANETPTAPTFSDHYVIIGSLEKDRPLDGRSGPELLTWALNDLLFLDSGQTHSEVLDHSVTMLSGMFVFGGLALLGFNSRQTARLSLAWRLSAALLLSLSLLALTVALLLAAGKIFPQISLIVMSVLTTLGLATFRHFSERRRTAWETDMASLIHRQAECYDVFISYSRRPSENLEWVKTHVYEPLCRARKSDGTPLRIFFDTDSIKIGESWHTKLINAIEQSRFFVPVWSDEYFQSDYCLLEMVRAAMKYDHQHDFILPLSKNLSEIPVEYTHIQFMDVTMRPDFIHEILNKVLAVDSRG